MREKDRVALLRSDRKKMLWAAPKIRSASNWVAGIWAVLFAYCVAMQTDGAVLLGVAAIPVALFWLFGRAMTYLAASVDKNWA